MAWLDWRQAAESDQTNYTLDHAESSETRHLLCASSEALSEAEKAGCLAGLGPTRSCCTFYLFQLDTKNGLETTLTLPQQHSLVA